MCQTVQLILVMEQGHRRQLGQQYPLVRGKVFRLGRRVVVGHHQLDLAWKPVS